MFDGVIRALCDVRHVPDMRKNLISLGTLDGNYFNYKSANGEMKVRKCAMTTMKGKEAGREYLQIDEYHNCRWSYNRRA